jgi:WD40 repeat protein
MPDLFISYSRKDKEFVRLLDESLKSRGREAWVDWEDIRPTEDFMQAIYGAIEGVDTFVFVLTPDSVASVVCGREIAHAVAHNKRMVPIVARDVSADTVPEPLAKLNWIFFPEGDDFEKTFEKATDTLISALDTDLEWIHAHTRLLTRAIEWENKGKNNSFVLRGEDLRSAERWLAEAGAQKERQPTLLQTEYIIASRKASVRRQRITLGGVTFALAVAIVLAVLAYLNESKAKGTLANSDFLRAAELIDQRRVDEALAFLARAARTQPRHSATADRVFTLLTQRGWMLPASTPATLPGRITSIAFTEGGGCLAASVSGEVAQVFDLRSGKPVTAPLRHDAKPIQIARLSPDGKLLATACGATNLDFTCEIWPRLPHYDSEAVPTDGYGRVWEVATGNPLTPPLTHSQAVLDICFDAKSARVATASADGTIRVCDARTGKDVATFPKHESPILSVRFSPDGTRLVAATTPLIIRDVASGERVSIPRLDGVIAAEYSPDGQQIAAVVSGTGDEGVQFQRVQLLAAANGQPTPEKLEPVPVISAICFDPSKKGVLVAYAGKNRNKDPTAGVDELDPETGKARAQHPMYGTPVSSVAILPGNEDFLTATVDRTVRLHRWVYDDHGDQQEIQPSNPLKFPSPPRHIECAPAGGQFAVVFGNGGNTAQLWNAPTRAEESQIVKMSTKVSDAPLKQYERTGTVADTSRNGKRVLKFDSEQSLMVCNARTGSRISGPFYPEGGYETLEGGEGGISAAKFSPKGDLFALGEGGDYRLAKGYARVWDAATGRPVTGPLAHTLAVTQVAFTEDGQRFLTVQSKFRSSIFSARLWDVRTGIALADRMPLEDERRKLPQGEEEIMTFDRSKGQITSYSDGVAEVRDAAFPSRTSVPEWLTFVISSTAPVPEWLAMLSEIVGGSRLNADTGAVEPVPEQWSKLQSLNAELAASTRQDPFTVLGKWFLGDPKKRTLSPYCKLTRLEYIERCITEGDEIFLNEAERLAAGNQKILERIKSRREGH